MGWRGPLPCEGEGGSFLVRVREDQELLERNQSLLEFFENKFPTSNPRLLNDMGFNRLRGGV
jgi:hypothetical protein